MVREQRKCYLEGTTFLCLSCAMINNCWSGILIQESKLQFDAFLWNCVPNRTNCSAAPSQKLNKKGTIFLGHTLQDFFRCYTRNLYLTFSAQNEIEWIYICLNFSYKIFKDQLWWGCRNSDNPFSFCNFCWKCTIVNEICWWAQW